jgi:regulation of enolase protein 1 (concanavalin A-like superfamily)
MIKKLIPLLLLLSLCVITSVNAQNIVWVAMDWDADSDGVNDSQEWVDLLTDEGYTIDFRPAYWDELTEDKVVELNAFDLVIVSATTQSGVLATDAAEASLWNSVTAPMLNCCTYVLRSTRWNWVNNGDATLPLNNGDQGSPLMQVIEPRHPIFKGIPLDPNNQLKAADPTLGSGHCTFIGTANAGNGTLIAKTVGDEWLWIAEWKEGVEFYNGCGTYATNLRMTFSIGGHEVAGNGRDVNPARGYNLTDEGWRLYLNTVQYMLGMSIIPGQARRPKPVDGMRDVLRDAVLNWRPGIYAATHNVYFGTDFNDVNEASETDPRGVLVSPNQDANSYDPPGLLDWNQTYYWRVDEVNAPTSPGIYKGKVWSLTVTNFTIVDNFEDYDDANNIIYYSWEDYYANSTGMTVGYFDPPFAERRVVHSGSQAMYMHYDNDGTVNEGTNYERSGTLLYSEAERTWADAQDWTKDGATSLTIWFRGLLPPGSFTEGPPITMTAGGTDIWDTADQFHFAYKQLSGEGSITARVVSISNTDPWAKAGVMIREVLEPGSVHTMIVVTPGNGVSLQRRVNAGAGSDETTVTDITAPQWVRVTRSGNTFTGEYSDNGNTWTALGSVDIAMLSDVYIGLCLTSHNVNATCTAEFSDVSTSTSVTGNWQSQDIGVESNIGEQLYAVLQDDADNSAIVNYLDPAATNITTWTQWSIPLSTFTGVNLQSITKLTIGVGDRASTQPNGAGDLYIDDIRLYQP